MLEKDIKELLDGKVTLCSLACSEWTNEPCKNVKGCGVGQCFQQALIALFDKELKAVADEVNKEMSEIEARDFTDYFNNALKKRGLS